MEKKTKIAVGTLSVIFVLGLVSATYAWFISLNRTQAGAIRTALVRWLPEEGPGDGTLPVYGALAAGGSVDTDGIPHVLPGDSLLARRTVDGDRETVFTTLARAYADGETEGTVINREVRDCAVEDKTLRVIWQQRHIRTVETAPDVWTKNDLPLEAPPTIDNPDNYDIEIQYATQEIEEENRSITVFRTITAYTNRTPGGDSYRQTAERRVIVTHETPTRLPQVTDAAWGSGELAYTAEETVLYTDGSNTTRTQLELTRTPAAGTPAGRTELPLSAANASTVHTNVRAAVSAVLYNEKENTYEPLALETANGIFYLGKWENGNFIDLLRFTLAEESAYAWTAASEQTDAWAEAGVDQDGKTAWHLWDLTLTSGGKSVPPPEAGPDFYQVLTLLEVAGKPHGSITVPGLSAPTEAEQQTYFESRFNALYCTDSPSILLQVRLYARQEAFMEWTEFCRQERNIRFEG